MHYSEHIHRLFNFKITYFVNRIIRFHSLNISVIYILLIISNQHMWLQKWRQHEFVFWSGRVNERRAPFEEEWVCPRADAAEWTRELDSYRQGERLGMDEGKLGSFLLNWRLPCLTHKDSKKVRLLSPVFSTLPFIRADTRLSHAYNFPPPFQPACTHFSPLPHHTLATSTFPPHSLTNKK